MAAQLSVDLWYNPSTTELINCQIIWLSLWPGATPQGKWSILYPENAIPLVVYLLKILDNALKAFRKSVRTHLVFVSARTVFLKGQLWHRRTTARSHIQ